MNDDPLDLYIETHSKSYTMGILLAVFLGPIGLFYSSWVAALILCVIAVVSAATIVGPVMCWLLAFAIAPIAISNHNERVEAAAKLHYAKR